MKLPTSGGVKEDRGEQNLLRVELTGGGMVVGFMFEGGRAERLAMRGGEIVFERVE